MKKVIRFVIGYSFALPFAFVIYIHSLFTGKKKAVEFWGPAVTYFVKVMAQITLIPKIKDPADFDWFAEKMKQNLHRLSLLYDTEIAQHDDRTMVVHYHNCPHCEAFRALGLSELGRYACHSDWEIASENTGLWRFERTSQIGTGDKFCNHTYKGFENIK